MSDNYHEVELRRQEVPFHDSSRSPSGSGTSGIRPTKGRRRRCLSSPASGRTCRILLVEDDSGIGLAVTELLRRAGHQVEWAADGEAGWSALTARPFDLLITDHMMPRLCGMELIWRLHAAGFTMPVIVTSGLTCVEIINMAPEPKPWFTAFLQKPFGPRELLETVDRILAKEPALAATGT